MAAAPALSGRGAFGAAARSDGRGAGHARSRCARPLRSGRLVPRPQRAGAEARGSRPASAGLDGPKGHRFWGG